MATGTRLTIFLAVLGLGWSVGRLVHAEGAAREVMFRARVTKLTPEQPARIFWRWGGEGLGGQPVRGEITRFLPDRPAAPDAGAEDKTDDLATDAIETEKRPEDRVLVEEATYTYEYLKPGTWSRLYPISTFGRTRGRLPVTFTIEGHQTGVEITGSELELEFLWDGKPIRRFAVSGPDGPTFGVVIPFHRLGKGGEPTREFAEEAGSLLHYVQMKMGALNALPWAAKPVPKRYALATDCYGYRPGSGYGCRTTDKETMLAEYQVLRLMGINSTRGCPQFIMEMVRDRQGIGRELARAHLPHTTGYPINCVHVADGSAPVRHPGDGCPYYPENIQNLPKRVQDAVNTLMGSLAGYPIEEVWALTVDEIGTVFDGAPEGKDHQGSCPYCREGFRQFVQGDGRTLADFGAPAWEDIRSTYGYWAISFWETQKRLEDAVSQARESVSSETRKTLNVGSEELLSGRGKPGGDSAAEEVESDLEAEEKRKKRDTANELISAEERLRNLMWTSNVIKEKPDGQTHRLSPEGWNLLYYYSRRFNCEAAAMLFEPLQKAFEAQNERKRQALARGETQTPAAKQPWIYSYALRGNTFLMGGHSLGFFDFYRYADNAFVYETSNRDRRVWQWDSYLCDVGRSLSRFMGKRFGIYVKPHRGAPVQRTLTAVARGVRMIYWYTYGPDWAKGDTFGGDIPTLQALAHVARLIASAEEVTYDSDWAVPAEVAIVRPRTDEFFSGSASWENGKWVYTALQHAHVPVDPLDEHLLMSEDLSRYRVIVICGDTIRRDVAGKLKSWTERGGTLITTGWGMAEDESKRPLELLLPVFGLKSRKAMDLWSDVPRYGATHLGAVQPRQAPPENAAVTGSLPLNGSLTPVVGREILDPEATAQVMATTAKGQPIAIRNRFGKGTAWLIGFYAGLEYAVETMRDQPFRSDKRSFVAGPVLDAGVKPVVDAAEPLVEGVLLKNRDTGRQAIILINWKFRVDTPLAVTVRSPAPITSARSLALDLAIPAEKQGDVVQLVLPKLAEGDILLLE